MVSGKYRLETYLLFIRDFINVCKSFKVHNFKKLKVWNKSRILVSSIYEIVKSFPKSETFGLISQMKRCSISIPSNIAEGCGKNSNKHFKIHIEVALGSSYELETQMILSVDLKYIDEETFKDTLIKINEVSKMLIGLRNNYN